MMTNKLPIRAIKNRQAQRGIALLASLIILVLMTIVGLSILRGNNLFEKVGGNGREKQRAFQSAQDALLYAEWWLSSPSASLTYSTCSTTVSPTKLQICDLDPGPSLTALAAVKVYSNYVPPGMSVAAGGGLATTGDINYTQNPGIYINCLSCGIQVSGQNLYRITAIGYGGISGSSGAVAVVQSVYALGGSSSPVTPLSGL